MDLDKVKGTTLSCRLCHESSHMCHPKKQDPEKVSIDCPRPTSCIACSLHFKHEYRANYTAMHRHTLLCDPGTSLEHLSIDREDECTSRLQENISKDEEALELEA